ncbi:MAG TPA: regulatory protein RecX [Candidatus Scatomorpha pullicola]|nr:regulatory protein RecX [Candidatus Scatomorpha pullicola]
MTAEETRKKALSLLERRDYGSEELCAKLVEKGAEPDEARAAVRYMVRVGFIDDERYAAMVVRHYAAKGYGVGRVREELRRRKLDRELWDAALAELPEPDETVDALLRAKLRGKAADRDTIRKAGAALVRRGFTWEAVKAATDRYLAEMEFEE